MEELFSLLKEAPFFIKALIAAILGGIIFSILKKAIKTIFLLLVIIAVYLLLENYVYM